ncbi:hypothetical protein Y032_0189g1204 [Ancylostoma ceylanicum]|nr:hypothetical protein Y032_0189g1204 [Ancylostoma ceylanicum]
MVLSLLMANNCLAKTNKGSVSLSARDVDEAEKYQAVVEFSFPDHVHGLCSDLSFTVNFTYMENPLDDESEFCRFEANTLACRRRDFLRNERDWIEVRFAFVSSYM